MVHHKKDVFRAIVSMAEEANLKDGDTVNRPYRSSLTVDVYTRGSDVTIQDLTDTNEALTIATNQVVGFYVDDLDALQSHYPTANQYADDAAVKLGNQIDGDVMGEYDTATNDVDEADVGGTAANGITVTVANIDRIFTAALRKLMAQNAPTDKLFAVISPQFYQVLLERLSGKESALGDNTGTNGHVGRYMGFELYVSNNCGWSAKLLIGTLPTDADTVVINGVTFTFETGTIDAAGKVKAVTDAATSITNLVAAINAPGTTSATFQAVSAANQLLLKNITATAVSGGLTVKAEGWSYVAVSETLTAAADVWTPALQIQHLLFGVKGAIDLVIQKRPYLQIKDVPTKLGKNLLTGLLYGLKTFAEGTSWLVDVNVRSDAY